MALTVGETLTIEASVAGATAAEVRLGGAGAAIHAMTITGGKWAVNIATDEMQPGPYQVQVWATLAGGSKKVVAREQFVLSPGLTEGDLRSENRRALDNINAMLLKQAGEGVKRYKINGRELERYSVAELLQLKSHYERRVTQETRRARGLNPFGPRIAVRF